MDFFLIIGLSQGVLLSVLLFYKSVSSRSNAWLMGLFVLLISAYISGPVLDRLFGPTLGSFLIDPLIFLIGPSFYLYIISFLRPLGSRDLLLHASVFLFYLPVMFWFQWSKLPEAPTPASLQAIYRSAFAVSVGLFKFFHLIVYFVLSYRALQRHEEQIKRIFADLTGRDLGWLRYMLWAFIVLVLASLAIYLVALQYPEQQQWLTGFNLVLLSLFILTLFFFAFQQNDLFDYAATKTEAAFAKKILGAPPGPKYEKSGLSGEEAENIQSQILAFMDAGGYIDSDLTLTAMAEAIGVAPHKISEVLSRYLNTSFYDLVNERRIGEIRQAILDPGKAHLTILAIAYEYGYNSKSTFNAAFKKFTGLTPTAYKRAKALKSKA